MHNHNKTMTETFYTTRLEPILDEIIAAWGIPGMAVGIVEEGRIVYTKTFGLQSLESGAPVTPGSLFCVASISKVFVAVALLQLAERGALDLDEPLVRYLPYFALDDPRSAQITARQVLSHTSGMPDLDDFEYDHLVRHPEYDEGAAERFVRGQQSKKMVATPGEQFLYSNLAYDVAGDLIAKIASQPFETYMKEHVLLPAGMAESSFLLADVPRERLAVPHLRAPGMAVNPIYPYHRADAPASFLHSSVVEMCRWAIACLDGARNDLSGQGDRLDQGDSLGHSDNNNAQGCPLLSPAGFEQMWTPVVERGYPPFYAWMGLGWNLGEYHGVKIASHGGMGFGWTDFLMLLPGLRRGAVILCNEESSAIVRTRYAVLDALLGRTPYANTISFMVPISQALEKGGIQAAYDCYARLKRNEGDPAGGTTSEVASVQAGNGDSAGINDPTKFAYFFDEDELINLALQLIMAGKTGMAVDVLRLNLHAFPEYIETYRYLADLYQQLDDPAAAEAILRQAAALAENGLATL